MKKKKDECTLKKVSTLLHFMISLKALAVPLPYECLAYPK